MKERKVTDCLNDLADNNYVLRGDRIVGIISASIDEICSEYYGKADCEFVRIMLLDFSKKIIAKIVEES